MPKLKTRKSLIKKIKVTGSGKLKVRATGQNHYNSRETGSQVRAKRKNHNVYAPIAKNITKSIHN